MKLDVVLMRGGTSRGPVLRSEQLPEDPVERDRILVELLEGAHPQLDGLGGGTPTTSKVVIVETQQRTGAGEIGFAVGNLVIGNGVLDWEGTCGNMTAAAALFAFEEGLVVDGSTVTLLNRSTARPIEVELGGDRALHRRGGAAVVLTRHLDPGGSVLGSILPTGAPRDTLEVDGASYECTIIDVTHPYLFLGYEAVVGDDDGGSAAVAQRIERIRGAACVRLGSSPTIDAAASGSPAVPRAVLVRDELGADGELRIVAVSMGRLIDSVPVTAAMCLAAARAMPGTIVGRGAERTGRSSELVVSAPRSSIAATAELGETGDVRSASVERTARSLLRGEAWV